MKVVNTGGLIFMSIASLLASSSHATEAMTTMEELGELLEMTVQLA